MEIYLYFVRHHVPRGTGGPVFKKRQKKICKSSSGLLELWKTPAPGFYVPTWDDTPEFSKWRWATGAAASERRCPRAQPRSCPRPRQFQQAILHRTPAPFHVLLSSEALPGYVG